jgi:hypothetical protein
MYIIIRGGVNVRIRRVNLDGKIENPVVTAMYDGEKFGDLALMNAPKPKGLVATLLKAGDDGHMFTMK